MTSAAPLGDGCHGALVVHAGRSRQKVRLVGDGLLEGIDGLLHLAAGDVGLPEARVHLVAYVRKHLELQSALVGGHRIGGAIESHEADSKVEQGLRGIGVRLVESGLAEGHAGLGRLALLEQGVAHSRIGLVGREVLAVRHRDLEMLHRAVEVMERGVGHAHVVVHGTARIVGGIPRRLLVGFYFL